MPAIQRQEYEMPGEIHPAITAVQIFLYPGEIFAVLFAGHIGLPVGKEANASVENRLLFPAVA